VAVLTRENDLLPRPMGVLIDAAFTDNATGYFGFDSDPNALGMARLSLGQDDPLAGGLAEGF
jgi:hypothetical protein